MKLSQAQVTQFQEQGYVAVPDFFSAPEVKAMQAEVSRLKDEGLLRNVATEGDGKSISKVAQNLQIYPLFPKSTFFRALVFDAKVIEAISQLLGDPFVHYSNQIFLKPAHHGAGTGWHTDNAYWKVSDPSKGTGMWTAIHDATLANGTMRVVPQSHQEAPEFYRDPNSDHHLTCKVDESRAKAIELPAGGVLFFNFGILHCTGGNQTDKDRAGLALHFLNAAFAPVPDPDPKMIKPYLSGPQASWGEKEYGVDLKGAWEKVVAAQAR